MMIDRIREWQAEHQAELQRLDGELQRRDDELREILVSAVDHRFGAEVARRFAAVIAGLTGANVFGRIHSVILAASNEGTLLREVRLIRAPRGAGWGRP